MIKGSPQIHPKNCVLSRKSLLRVPTPRIPTIAHKLHQDVEMAIINPPQTSQRRPLTESSELLLLKGLVKLLPEDLQPESNHEIKWCPAQPFKILTEDNLPPYETTLMAIERLLHLQSATLHIYFIGEDEMRKILEDVYSGNASQLALCELFAAAAVGAQWEERVPAEVEHAYFNTVRAHLDDCMEVDDLRTMRILGLCSMFLMPGEHNLSWSYIGNALQIGHSRGLQLSQKFENIGHSKWIGLRRLWRTLVFFESWLAASLGRVPIYSPGYGEVDLSRSERSLDDQDPSGYNEFQLELVKIGVLNAKILKEVFAPPNVNLRVVRGCMSKLEDWFDNLPTPMRLASMLAPDVNPRERATVFTIHIMYLAAIILLTRKVMVEMISGKNNFLDGTLQDSIPYVKACISAAKQTSGILALLYTEHGGGLFKKYWLAIYSSFNASILLIFHAAQKKLLGRSRVTYQNDLNDASKFVTTIEAYAENDELAYCYLQILVPFQKAFGETDKEYSLPHPRLSSPLGHSDSASIYRPLHLPFSNPGQLGVFITPFSAGNSNIVVHDLLNTIREPHVFGGDVMVNTTNHNLYPTSSKPHPNLWDSGASSSSSLEINDTPPFLPTKASPTKRRRDEDGTMDKGWKYNKMIRFSPEALEAFLARVA